MIDFVRDDLLTFEEGAPVMRVTPATMRRYATDGVGGVRLDSIKLGGLRYTSRQAIAAFVAKLNGHDVHQEQRGVVAPPDIDKPRMESSLDEALKVA